MSSRIFQARTLCAKPKSGVYTGPDKYLKLQRVHLSHTMFPVREDDSLFLYVYGGMGKITINGVTFSLAQGTFCWLQHYHVFTIEPELGSELELGICAYDYQLSSYLAYNGREITNSQLCVQALPILELSESAQADLLEILDEIESLSEDTDAGSALIKAALLGEMDSMFCSTLKKTESDLQKDMPLGWSACIFVANMCTSDLEARTVANYFGVTVDELNHELKLSVGMNFSQLLNRSRVHVAMTSILFESLPFNFIASHSGFKSEIVFFRTFKKLTGLTPQEYREKITSKGEHVQRHMITSEAYLSIIDYIYKNFSEPISIKSMEKALYLSESAIRKLLSEKMGMTYKDYLDMFRIRYSEALLIVTDLPVVDVSVAAGFNSVRTFMRVFQTRNELSPSAYRKKYGRGGGD